MVADIQDLTLPGGPFSSAVGRVPEHLRIKRRNKMTRKPQQNCIHAPCLFYFLHYLLPTISLAGISTSCPGWWSPCHGSDRTCTNSSSGLSELGPAPRSSSPPSTLHSSGSASPYLIAPRFRFLRRLAAPFKGLKPQSFFSSALSSPPPPQQSSLLRNSPGPAARKDDQARQARVAIVPPKMR